MSADWDNLFAGISSPSASSDDTLPLAGAQGGQGAGWYGKLPAIGDFASRRLDDEFIRAWDEWLQHGVGRLRTSLGDGWLDAYLAAPIWNFAIFPGVLHESLAYAGVLMSSADRVGRYFPLTLCAPVMYPQQLALEIEQGTHWYAGLRQIALGALSADASIESLDGQLGELGLAELDRPGMPQNYELAMAFHGAASGSYALLPTSLSAAIPATQRAFFQQQLQGLSLWWAEVPETHGAAAVTHVSLSRSRMTPEEYVRMVCLQG